ncbi:hypothetical protein ACLI4Z_13350 [Natrialbaceae archaeon A-arb3/5]
MECDNCNTTGEVAYTLTAYVEAGPERAVDLHFCSTDCLRVWT